MTTDAAARPRLVTGEFVLLLAAAFCYFLAFGVTMPVLPAFVTEELGGGDLAVGVIVGIMAVSALAVRPVASPRIATWGFQRVLLASIVAGAVSFVGYGFTTVLWQLVLLRLLTGAAHAMVLVAALTRVLAVAPADRRGAAVSYFSVAPYLGLGIGPVIGQPAYDAFGPVGGFGVAAGVALVGVPLALLVRNARTSADAAPGPRLSRAALWPGTVLGLGILGAIGMAGFLPLYVAELHGGSSQWIFLMYAAVVLLGRVLGGSLADRFGAIRTGTVATGLIVAGLAGFALAPGVLWLYAAVVPLGLGMALQYPGLLALAVNRVPERERDAAVSTFTMFFDVATGFGGLLMGGVAAAGGYRSAFGAAAVCSVIGLVLLRTVVRAGGPVPAVSPRPTVATASAVP